MLRHHAGRPARLVLALLLLAPLLLSLGAPRPSDAKPGHEHGPKPIPNRYIVVLAGDDGRPVGADRRRGRGRSREQVRAAAQALGRKHNAKVHHVYSALLERFAAEVPAEKVKALRQDPEVVAVVPDYEVELAAQKLPRGVDFVKADKNPVAKLDGVDERVNADVAVLDTGIFRHPDLNVVGGYNCTSDNEADWGDRNGHGTHAAGIISAKDNGFGVVGVAPGARLWAIKVIPDRGTASDSMIICGLQWVYEFENVIDVVNTSIGRLGSPIEDENGLTQGTCAMYLVLVERLDVYHYSWCQVAVNGIPVVVAAMNWGIDAKRVVPAAYDEVMTVSNMNWYFPSSGPRRVRYELWRDRNLPSDLGADVDVAAPGVDILSTLPRRALGKPYGRMTGTSMAAPHVAGAAALYVAAHGRTSALQVMNAIKSRARIERLRGDPDGITEGILNAESS